MQHPYQGTNRFEYAYRPLAAKGKPLLSFPEPVQNRCIQPVFFGKPALPVDIPQPLNRDLIIKNQVLVFCNQDLVFIDQDLVLQNIAAFAQFEKTLLQ